MSDINSFHHHYILKKLNGIIVPIREILHNNEDPSIPRGLQEKKIEETNSESSANESEPSQEENEEWEEKGALVLRECLNSLIDRIDRHLDVNVKNEWIGYAEGVKNLSLAYNILRMHQIFSDSEEHEEIDDEEIILDPREIKKFKKVRMLEFIGRTSHQILIERLISYIWYQSRLIHMTEELLQFSKTNPSIAEALSENHPSRKALLNITEKDTDLIKKIIETEGKLREIERDENSVHLVKELSFPNLCNVLRNTYGYRTKFFKKFLEKYHRKHFYLREEKVEISSSKIKKKTKLIFPKSPPRSDPLTLDPISSSKHYRSVLMVSPFQPVMNFERDASILTQILIEGEKEHEQKIINKKAQMNEKLLSKKGIINNNNNNNNNIINIPTSNMKKYRVLFQDLLEKLNEETGNSKHKGYLKQMKMNPSWKHVFNIKPYVQLKPTGGYNRKFVNSINKMFSERHKHFREKKNINSFIPNNSPISFFSPISTPPSNKNNKNKNNKNKNESEDLLPSYSPTSPSNNSSFFFKSPFSNDNNNNNNNNSNKNSPSFSPVRHDVRIPVSEIEKKSMKHMKQFIAYINCWHFDKFQILPGDVCPMIRKQMVDLKDVSKLTLKSRKIPVLELLNQLKQENPKKYGYITESDFTRWLGQNFPTRCIVVNSNDMTTYNLLLDDDVVFRINLHKLISWINVISRKDGGFGVPFEEVLAYCRRELKLKHFKKQRLEKYLKQYNNVFKLVHVVSLSKDNEEEEESITINNINNNNNNSKKKIEVLGKKNEIKISEIGKKKNININNNNNNNDNNIGKKNIKNNNQQGGGNQNKPFFFGMKTRAQGRRNRGRGRGRGGRGQRNKKVNNNNNISNININNNNNPNSSIPGSPKGGGASPPFTRVFHHHHHHHHHHHPNNPANKNNSLKKNDNFTMDSLTQEIVGMDGQKKPVTVVFQPKMKKTATITDSRTGEIVNINSTTEHPDINNNILINPNLSNSPPQTQSSSRIINPSPMDPIFHHQPKIYQTPNFRAGKSSSKPKKKYRNKRWSLGSGQYSKDNKNPNPNFGGKKYNNRRKKKNINNSNRRGGGSGGSGGNQQRN